MTQNPQPQGGASRVNSIEGDALFKEYMILKVKEEASSRGFFKTARMDILDYIVKVMDDDGRIYLRQREVARNTGYSTATVNAVFRALSDPEPPDLPILARRDNGYTLLFENIEGIPRVDKRSTFYLIDDESSE